MAVSSNDSVVGGRSNWGFPKELSQLSWRTDEHGSSLVSEDLEVQARVRPRGPEVPLVAPLFCLQRRADGPVHVLGWLRGRFRPARVHVRANASEHLQFVDGHHQGLMVNKLRLVVNAADRFDGPTELRE